MLKPKSHSFNLTHLSSYAMYSITVTATNDAQIHNESSHSDIAMVKTLAGKSMNDYRSGLFEPSIIMKTTSVLIDKSIN